MAELLKQKPCAGFLEVHSENYFGGSPARRQLLGLRENYEVSLHGVGLSLGRADGLDVRHLQQLKALVDDVQPLFVSEHMAWNAVGTTHVPDLLPLPLTQEALDVMCRHVEQMQHVLGRQVLVENPSLYVDLQMRDMSEPAFLKTLARRTGCGILLDINNIAVSAHNLGFHAAAYLHEFGTFTACAEIHLAGYQMNEVDAGKTLYIDTHGNPVYPEVWALYEQALTQFGDVPTLVEWDANIPALDVLLAEAQKADAIRERVLRDNHIAAG